MLKILVERAINAALKQDWYQAISINLEILDHDPLHIPTLNRLAKAYKETGQIQKAIKIYTQALQHDRFNSIAQKNLTLLTNSTRSQAFADMQIETDFIDEPGRTKSIPLIRLGDPQLINSLQPGQVVKLVVRERVICVMTDDNQHIGALTDDMVFLLKDLIRAGNRYRASIKSSSLKSIILFIREVYRTPKYQHCPTFSM